MVNHYHAQYRGHHSNIMKYCLIFLFVGPVLTAGQTIKMISTEPDSPLPDKAGYAQLALAQYLNKILILYIYVLYQISGV